MNLDRMDYIFAIAEEQSLTRAANRLYIAQSTLSMYLNRLESQLGVKLFDRTKTPILPPPAGILYIDELRKIQNIENKMLQQLEHMAHPHRTLTIGIGLLRSNLWMPRILPMLRRCYPELSINVVEQYDEKLLSDLLSGTIDIIFSAIAVEDSSIKTIQLATEDVLIIAPRSSGLVPDAYLSENAWDNPYEISEQQLDSLPILNVDNMHDIAFASQVEALPKRKDTVSISTTSMRTAISLVSRGLGYLFQSPALLETNSIEDRSHIVYCTLKDVPTSRNLMTCYRLDSANLIVLQELVRYIQEHILPLEKGLRQV